MLKQAVSIIFGGSLCASLLWFDHLLGNGFMNMMHMLYCKCFCFVKKTLRDHAKSFKEVDSNDFNGLVLALEMVALLCTMVLLNRYKKHGMEPMDKIGDKESNELLEKQKRQRISRSMDSGRSPDVSSPQQIQPLNVEVPVLHMAIIDPGSETLGLARVEASTRDKCNLDIKPNSSREIDHMIPRLVTFGTSRSQPERGDAGDIYNITDTAILSVASLLDRDFQLPESTPEDSMDLGEGNTVQYNNDRYLWDVIEEE